MRDNDSLIDNCDCIFVLLLLAFILFGAAYDNHVEAKLEKMHSIVVIEKKIVGSRFGKGYGVVICKDAIVTIPIEM